MWHFSGLPHSPSQACWKSTTSLHSCFQLFVNLTYQLLHSRPQRTNWPQTAWTLTLRCLWMLRMAVKRTASHSNPCLNTDTTASKWLLWPMLELENIHTGIMNAPWLEVRISQWWFDLFVLPGESCLLVILCLCTSYLDPQNLMPLLVMWKWPPPPTAFASHGTLQLSSLDRLHILCRSPHWVSFVQTHKYKHVTNEV